MGLFWKCCNVGSDVVDSSVIQSHGYWCHHLVEGVFGMSFLDFCFEVFELLGNVLILKFVEFGSI